MGNVLRIVVYTDPNEFKERCRNWLLTDEAINNGLISAIDLIANGSLAYWEPYWFGLVQEGDKILSVALYCQPDGLVFSEIDDQAVPLIFESVSESIGVPRRLMGPEVTCDRLAKYWKDKGVAKIDPDGHWNVQWVKKVTAPARPAKGRLRKGESSDEGWVANWGKKYGEEKPAVVNVSEFMLRKLRRNELYVWENDGPKTMVTVSGFTDHGVRISAVFTPTEHRGGGYASIAVAVMTQDLLDQGFEFVTLHTREGDAAVRVYERLGYEQIERRSCYFLFDIGA